MINKLQAAWYLAARHHEGQRYKTPDPNITLLYLTHLGAVMLEAQEAIRKDPELDAELVLICAILHDTLEDTELSEDVLREHFGEQVLAGIKALTKNEELPTKSQQMADSLARIKVQPREIAVVKLCDRIVNMNLPPAHWGEVYIERYRQEAQDILQQLGFASSYLSVRLMEKIASIPITKSASITTGSLRNRGLICLKNASCSSSAT